MIRKKFFLIVRAFVVFFNYFFFFISFELKQLPIEYLGDLLVINPDLYRTFTRGIDFDKIGALTTIPFCLCEDFDAIYIFKIFIFRPTLKAILSEELISIENKLVDQSLDNFSINRDYRIIIGRKDFVTLYNSEIKFLTAEKYGEVANTYMEYLERKKVQMKGKQG